MPVNYNGKKSNVISVLKRKNGALAKAIMEMDKSDLDELQRSMLGTYVKGSTIPFSLDTFRMNKWAYLLLLSLLRSE